MEVEAARVRIERTRNGFDSRRVRYLNKPDQRGLRNVTEYFKDACPWATRAEVESWARPTNPDTAYYNSNRDRNELRYQREQEENDD